MPGQGMTAALRASQFAFFLLAAIATFFPQELDEGRHPPDRASTCTFCDGIIFDFIVVGAGSAGSVVANRLTENPQWNVLLIEAGGDENFISDVPLFYQYLSRTRFNWNYTTVRQEKACLSTNGSCDYPRGLGLGGSSTTNAMMYVRGNRRDYDEWAADGSFGWSYREVLPYFLKSENVTIPELRNSPYHSTRGPLSVSYARYSTPARDDLLRAGVEFGLPLTDYNGAVQSGIAPTQLTTDGTTRVSTGKAFLDPIRDRPNLFVYKESLVRRVIFSPQTRKALGVEFLHRGRLRQVYAVKEVILSAGSINTPQILMLSGVGPRQQLQQFGIPVIADLPVGENLQDHNLVGVQFLLNQSVNIINPTFMNASAILEYARNRSGVLTSNGIDVLAFFNFMKNGALPPEIQFHITTLTPNPRNLSIVAIGVTLLDPKSRGWVRLNTSNPFGPPLINPNYYSNKGDFERTLRGTIEAINYMNTNALRKYDPKLITTNIPQCTRFLQKGLEAYLTCYIKYHTRTIYHPVGTARMGLPFDPRTVVDPELKVRGVQHLRVIDASVMPKITRGNTNAPTIMIGEKGSDIIKRKYIRESPSLVTLWA